MPGHMRVATAGCFRVSPLLLQRPIRGAHRQGGAARRSSETSDRALESARLLALRNRCAEPLPAQPAARCLASRPRAPALALPAAGPPPLPRCLPTCDSTAHDADPLLGRCRRSAGAGAHVVLIWETSERRGGCCAVSKMGPAIGARKQHADGCQYTCVLYGVIQWLICTFEWPKSIHPCSAVCCAAG